MEQGLVQVGHADHVGGVGHPQQPDRVDAGRVKAALPHGEVTVRVVKGGLDVPDDTSSDVAIIASAALLNGLELVGGIGKMPEPACEIGCPVVETPETAGAWKRAAVKHDGSWWNDWSSWLAERSGRKVKPPGMGSNAHPPLVDAPGTYVLQK